ncbi:MAG: hypothetical protein AAGB04_25375 [Pseudomonadota bacterium]
MDRIIDTASEAVMATDERRLGKLEREKLILTEKLETHSRPARSFEEQFELAFRFLQNPGNSGFPTDWTTRDWC